jgi:flagellar basal body-associated protein FliL
MGRGIKILLFIGIFLLLIGVCLYGYFSYEGFQQSSGSCGSSLNTSGNFCPATSDYRCPSDVKYTQCLNNTPEPNAIPNETPDETDIYDIYESKNLNKLYEQNDVSKTTVKPYNMAGELGDFDLGAPIPWDYDNRQLEPTETVWGSVHPDVSTKLFEKSYTRALFGSANPEQFIESNNDTGENKYRSNMFQMTVYGIEGMAIMQQIEAVAGFYEEQIMEETLDAIFMPQTLRRNRQILEIIEAGKPKILGITNTMAKSTVTYEQAVAIYNDQENLKKRVSKQTNLQRNTVANTLDPKFKNSLTGVTGVDSLSPEGMKELEKKIAIIERQNIKRGLNSLRSSEKVSVTSTQPIFKTNNLRFKWNKSSYIKKGLGTVFRPITAALSFVNIKTIKNATKKFSGLFMRTLMRMIASIVLTKAVLVGMCTTAAAAAASAAATSWTGIGLIFLGGSAAYSLSCNIALVTVTLLEVSLITWIPALMSQLIDEQISACPSTHPWNIKQAFYELKGGEAGWEIFSNIPMVGDIAAVLGPYLCWGHKEGKPDAVLKQEISSPYYYYDPTLSIYTAVKKYARTANPSNPTIFDQITSGVLKNSPEYTNHYLYKDNYGLYPFLVDFSHRNMLNKMAQYYYETSRKNMTIDPDGTGRFEYISKIYGIISSSELSCDIQCEISEITVDTLHGTKLCERIVPVPPDAPAWYHDRRFYFYVDISKGDSLVTPENEACEFYLNYVQSPTFNRPRPSCDDFGTGGITSTSRRSDECKKLLDWETRGWHNVYNVYNGTIDFDRITIAGVACNKRLMITKDRDKWNAQIRMNDNMEKYIVTGCTHVNGTAPDVYDSKNENVEGIQVGDTPVSVGPIGGKWHPPEFVPENLKMPDQNGNIVDIEVRESSAPPATDCAVVRNRFTRYGTVTRSDRTLDEAAMRAQIANITNIQPSCKMVDWEKSVIQDWNNRSQAVSGMDFLNVAKKINVIWMDCITTDLNCKSKRESFMINMAAGSALGFLGSRLTYNRLPVGAVIAAGASTIGVGAVLTCLAEDIKNQVSEGTFVQNGILKTSHQGLFILDHGPTIQYSPGYVPTIQINPPELTMQNCANRYTVRKFISLFNNTYASTERYNLTKILNISPRRVTNSNVIPCCVFNIEYEREISTGGNTVTKQTLHRDIKMNMILNNINTSAFQISDKTKNIILYQPSTNISFNNIPLAEPFRRNTQTVQAPTTTDSDIQPSTCNRPINCTDPDLQERLFDQFNERHLGVFISKNTQDTPIRAWTPLPKDGIKSCVFEINFEKFQYNSLFDMILPGSSGSPQNNFERRKVTMYLGDILNVTDETKCLYDLEDDDYPTNLWYRPIPLMFFDVPVRPHTVNDKFQRFINTNPTKCTDISECSNVRLMDHVITQFNSANTNRKINSVYRTFTPFVDNGTGISNAVCDYDVEMLRTDRDIGQTLANQETVRFYLTPSSSDDCLYDYDLSQNTDYNTNTGYSLNNTQLIGLLETPYTWSSNFLNDVRQQIYDAILPVLGLDIVKTTQNLSKNAKDMTKIIYDNTLLIQELQACSTLKCSDPYILQKILNRYNFQGSPSYPDVSTYNHAAQYGAQERRIIDFTRAGLASPTRCHVEVHESINTYDDFLYDAKSENKRIYVQKYQFDITGDSCTNIGIQSLTPDEIAKGVMVIKGEAYGINSDITKINPRGQTIINPTVGTSFVGSSLPEFSYTSPVVNCMNPAVLDKVQMAYEKCDVSSSNALPRKPAFNRMRKVLEWFNPAPNICEYKMYIQHVYFDLDYGYYYSLPDAEQNSSRDVVSFNPVTSFSTEHAPSYIVAKWLPDTDYDIETGILKLNKPIVDEYFYPDLSLRDGKFYRTAASTVPLNLPFLASEGLSIQSETNPNGLNYSVQLSRFKTVDSHSFPINDQTAWVASSCNCVPDQRIVETTPTFCS